jgi:hypothetical protein
MIRQGSRGILLVGTAVSLAVHAGLGAGFVRLGTIPAETSQGRGEDLSRVEILLIPEIPPEPEAAEPLRLGVERGSPDSAAWLGFEDATEHLARQGSVDQSAMTLMESPGDGAAMAEAAPPGARPESESPPLAAVAEAAATEEVPADPQTPAAETLAEAEPSPSAEPEQELEQELAAELLDAAQRVTDAVRQAVMLATEAAAELARMAELSQPAEAPARTPAQPQHRAELQTDAAEPPAAPAAPPSSTPGAAGEDGASSQGISTDREAIATAVRGAPTIRPGRVLATQGLEIQTRTPRWTYTTLMTRRPRNPTVEIFFGPDGRVLRADFVRDGATIYNTGFEDVDQPLLSAIYTWTARGKPIDELARRAPGGGEPAELRILITVLFS